MALPCQEPARDYLGQVNRGFMTVGWVVGSICIVLIVTGHHRLFMAANGRHRGGGPFDCWRLIGTCIIIARVITNPLVALLAHLSRGFPPE